MTFSKTCTIFYIVSFCLLFSCNSPEKAPFDLKCENLETPVGIDSKTPRLSWKFPLLNENISTCQIWLSTDSLLVIEENDRCWNKSTEATIIRTVYDGKPLESFKKYFWKVGYRTNNTDNFINSPVSSFTTGLMPDDKWEAKWITDHYDINYRSSPYFRKEFRNNQTIKRALLTIASAGLHELSINGKRVGNHFLDPMYTHFDKRILSVTHDVTSYIRKGKNVIGVQLGNGWYNHQSTAVWFFDKATWRNRPRFTAQLYLEYDNKKTSCIETDSTWLTTDSPIIFNSIYTAEHYDARKELTGWNESGFNTSSWKKAIETASPTQQIKSQLLCPIREITRYKPTTCVKLSDTCYVYHFPRNIAGTIELKVRASEGTILRLKHGELLNKNGHVDMANIDYHYRPKDNSDPFQTDIVVLSGKEDSFSPKFNYKGFQYVEVTSSHPISLTKENLIAIEMHSDVPQIGFWNSSSELLNKIWEATNSSYLANLFGYPTDCPQREKNGWTGDAHIAIETGLFNFDAITVYEKWMDDFRDEQKENGVLPCIIPTSLWGYDWANGVDWTSAVAIIPWEIYRFYGDPTLLQRMYPSIKKYVVHIESIAQNNLTDWGLGDWVPVHSTSNVTLTSSIYYFITVSILAKSAKILGYKEDASYYANLAKQIRNAINTQYLNIDTGIYASGTQTELSMPLYWKIVPEKHQSQVAANLNKKIVQDNYHLDVGLLGSKALLNALSENGYSETAYAIATQETYPSWGYWINNGATTLHENWRTDVVIDNSLNHIMFGEIGAWLYKTLGGIQIDDSNPGFKHIYICPFFPDQLTFLDIRYNTPYGWLYASWTRNKNNKISYILDIPMGISVTFVPPTNIISQEKKIFQHGKHKFELNINNSTNK